MILIKEFSEIIWNCKLSVAVLLTYDNEFRLHFAALASSISTFKMVKGNNVVRTNESRVFSKKSTR